MTIENAIVLDAASLPRIVNTSNCPVLQSGAVAATTAKAVERGAVVPVYSTEA